MLQYTCGKSSSADLDGGVLLGSELSVFFFCRLLLLLKECSNGPVVHPLTWHPIIFSMSSPQYKRMRPYDVRCRQRILSDNYVVQITRMNTLLRQSLCNYHMPYTLQNDSIQEKPLCISCMESFSRVYCLHVLGLFFLALQFNKEYKKWSLHLSPFPFFSLPSSRVPFSLFFASLPVPLSLLFLLCFCLSLSPCLYHLWSLTLEEIPGESKLVPPRQRWTQRYQQSQRCRHCYCRCHC